MFSNLFKNNKANSSINEPVELELKTPDEKSQEDTKTSLEQKSSLLFSGINTIASKISDFSSKIVLDFEEEQKKFAREKARKQSEIDMPPWVGYHEEDEMKAQILSLSSDETNFLRAPPAAAKFDFDFDRYGPMATATLKEDPELEKQRFLLVPKRISEKDFWRNYFYRVSLIKQSTQLCKLKSHNPQNYPSPSSASKPSVDPLPDLKFDGKKDPEASHPSPLSRIDANPLGHSLDPSTNPPQPISPPAAKDVTPSSLINPDAKVSVLPDPVQIAPRVSPDPLQDFEPDDVLENWDDTLPTELGVLDALADDDIEKELEEFYMESFDKKFERK